MFSRVGEKAAMLLPESGVRKSSAVGLRLNRAEPARARGSGSRRRIEVSATCGLPGARSEVRGENPAYPA